MNIHKCICCMCIVVFFKIQVSMLCKQVQMQSTTRIPNKQLLTYCSPLLIVIDCAYMFTLYDKTFSIQQMYLLYLQLADRHACNFKE